MEAPRPSNEAQRLEALRRYSVLDTLPEAAFDRIAQLASEVFDMPLAVINFVDEARQ
ncbi:hypothetical protein [Deinococcus peraridilitoris]|uniref:hypothetical protein n=1 Tax=Deinococcus peraridilitoris TaxID=432329 RepID=UPI00031EA6E7|nr:hypothetical protein [Deinococcus peraridilitoris]